MLAFRSNVLSAQCLVLLFVFCLCWRLAIGQVSAPGHLSEYSAKAASLTQLLDWVKWPAPTAGPIRVGVLGEDPFGGALEKLKPKHATQIDELKDCQIIFIPRSEGGNLNAILGSLAGASVLTVGESEGFAKQGGIVGFVMEGDQVRFEINTAAARQAGLKIDLRLLKLAKRVFNS
jgi:hypothetical protein